MKHHRFLIKFLIRWLGSALGLWIAASFIPSSISFSHHLHVLVIAGLILAIINTFIKPFLIFLSMPALLITLGLFLLVINGFTVYITSKIYSPLYVSGFFPAMFAGFIIGLVNYLITTVAEGIN